VGHLEGQVKSSRVRREAEAASGIISSISLAHRQGLDHGPHVLQSTCGAPPGTQRTIPL